MTRAADRGGGGSRRFRPGPTAHHLTHKALMPKTSGKLRSEHFSCIVSLFLGPQTRAMSPIIKIAYEFCETDDNMLSLSIV